MSGSHRLRSSERRSPRPIGVLTESDPKALPLPAPTKDARADELAWVRQHAQNLTDTMRVDVFDVLLGKIAADDLPKE